MKHHWVFLLLSNLPTAAAADAAGGAPALTCPPAPQISGAWTLPTQPVPVVLGPGVLPALTLPPTAGTAVVADATATHHEAADATHQRSDHEAESTDHDSNHEAAADTITTDHEVAAADATVIATHEEADGTNDEAGGPTDREAAEATNDEAGATGPAQLAAQDPAAAAAESAAAPPHNFIQTPMTPMTLTRVLRACAKAIGQESRGPVRRQLEISGSTRWRSINNLLKFNKHYNRVDNPHHHHGIQSHSGRDS